MNFIEIQSWPEIPSIGYFVSLFSQTFDLPEFPDIEVKKHFHYFINKTNILHCFHSI
jgi:hypothetical protein